MTTDTVSKIGRFELVRRLGRGSQGTVYLAHDPKLQRQVAIKLLASSDAALQTPSEGDSPLEGLISSRLKHPNIVSIYDAGDCPTGPYLVFEYVKGDTLAQLLEKKGAFSIKQASRLIVPILDAIAAAHKLDIIHLDISPRNILIDSSGTPRVMDFGLSRYCSQLPQDRSIATGTLRYMSPEHFAGETLGPYTDVFALASTFYELVTAKTAMVGNSVDEIIRSIVRVSVDLGALNIHPEGPAFARFLHGAYERKYHGRYADGSAMREAFEVFLRESGLAQQAQAPSGEHSTVEFLLRRMQRKQDFPTISRTLVDINRLTEESANTSADKLAGVILRDYALTSKLLKLVNSAFYGNRATEVKNISQAVVILGVQQVRMTANSLTFFGQLQKDDSSTLLKDSMTRSFLAGLIARHLAQRAKLRAAEEAFICGMFQNLGENLVIYYFAEEQAEIERLIAARGLGKEAAARGVLGVGYADLGTAVARMWQLPDAIVDSIRGLPSDFATEPENDDEKIRDFAVFANELCDLARLGDPAAQDIALEMLVSRFENSVRVREEFCLTLLGAGLEKLRQYAPIFEIDVARSQYCRAVQEWLDLERPDAPATAATGS